MVIEGFMGHSGEVLHFKVVYICIKAHKGMTLSSAIRSSKSPYILHSANYKIVFTLLPANLTLGH